MLYNTRSEQRTEFCDSSNRDLIGKLRYKRCDYIKQLNKEHSFRTTTQSKQQYDRSRRDICI